jgi:MFS family permease
VSAAAPAPTAAATAGTLARVRRAAVASFVGGVLEYYDWTIYASSSALIFARVFFTHAGAAGTLASFATFGTAYLARPLGAILLGHFGDRVGRKRVWLFSLVFMGTATFLVGCLPTYPAVGIMAPVLLVALRVCQGLSAGGELAGASTITLEEAPPRRRTFYTSWSLNGVNVGFIIATLVFLPIATLPSGPLLSWGWRVPFWASAVLIVFGYLVRRRVDEPEAFEHAKEEARVARVPLLQLLGTHWRDVIRAALCTLFSVSGTVIPYFGLSFASNGTGVDKVTLLWAQIASFALALVFQPAWALLADRIGRKWIFSLGCLGCAGFIFLFFHAVASGNVPEVFAASFLITSFFFAAPNAVYPAFFGDMFDVTVRYSGIGVGVQLGFILTGFSPAIAAAMVGTGRDWMPVAVFSAALSVIAAIAAMTAPARQPALQPPRAGPKHDGAGEGARDARSGRLVVEQQPHRLLTQPRDGDRDGRQRRDEVVEHGEAAEAGDGDIARHVEPAGTQRRDRADRHDVIDGEQAARADAAVEPGERGAMAAVAVEPGAEDTFGRQRNPALGEPAAEAAHAVRRGAGRGGAAEHGEVPVTEGGELARQRLGSRRVAHRDRAQVRDGLADHDHAAAHLGEGGGLAQQRRLAAAIASAAAGDDDAAHPLLVEQGEQIRLAAGVVARLGDGRGQPAARGRRQHARGDRREVRVGDVVQDEADDVRAAARDSASRRVGPVVQARGRGEHARGRLRRRGARPAVEHT